MQSPSNCTKCGRPRVGDLRFCAGCGAEFASAPATIRIAPKARDSEPWSIGQILLVVVVLLLAAGLAAVGYVTLVDSTLLQGLQTTEAPDPGASPTAKATATRTDRPISSSAATAGPPTATAPPTVQVELVRKGTTPLDHGLGAETLLVWAEFRNAGSVAVEPSGLASYILYRPDGAVLDDALFFGSVPSPIAPGESGYLLQHANLFTEDDISVGEVELAVDWQAADEPRRDLNLSRIDWRAEPIAGFKLEISGVAENPSSDPIWDGVLGMVFFDAAGTPIGGFYDNIAIGFVDGSGRQAFTVQSFGAPASIAGRIASYEAFAFGNLP